MRAPKCLVSSFDCIEQRVGVTGNGFIHSYAIVRPEAGQIHGLQQGQRDCHCGYVEMGDQEEAHR